MDWFPCTGGFVSSDEFRQHAYWVLNGVNAGAPADDWKWLAIAELVWDYREMSWNHERQFYQLTDAEKAKVQTILLRSVAKWRQVIKQDKALQLIFAQHFDNRWPTPAVLWSMDPGETLRPVLSSLIEYVQLEDPNLLSRSFSTETLPLLKPNIAVAVHILAGLARRSSHSRNLSGVDSFGQEAPKASFTAKQLSYVEQRRQLFTNEHTLLGIETKEQMDPSIQADALLGALDISKGWQTLKKALNHGIAEQQFSLDTVAGLVVDLSKLDIHQRATISAGLIRKRPALPPQKEIQASPSLRKEVYPKLVLYRYEIP